MPPLSALPERFAAPGAWHAACSFGGRVAGDAVRASLQWGGAVGDRHAVAGGAGQSWVPERDGTLRAPCAFGGLSMRASALLIARILPPRKRRRQGGKVKEQGRVAGPAGPRAVGRCKVALHARGQHPTAIATRYGNDS